MSDSWTLRDDRRDNRKTFDTRADAEDARDDLLALGATADDLEITAPEDDDAQPDGGEAVEPEVVESDTELPEHSVADDPIDWMPSHFIDSIQGVPVINRKGYAVIAQDCGISVTAEPVTRPPETDFEYAEFRAVATTQDGVEYSGYGSAHVDRDDDSTLLAELAETRAMKRATAWASGVGMTAIEEMGGADE
jgi:hypothetical protein